jgi:hypothetical protein
MPLLISSKYIQVLKFAVSNLTCTWYVSLWHDMLDWAWYVNIHETYECLKNMLDNVVSLITCVSINHQNQLEQMLNGVMFDVRIARSAS